jgi:hypothetical protein
MATTTMGALEELGQVVAAESSGRRRGGGNSRRHHGKRHDERDERHLKGLVHVQSRTGGLWILSYELRVSKRGDEREGKGQCKGRPYRLSHLRCDLTDKRIDAGAEDVAEHEHEQHPLADDSV